MKFTKILAGALCAAAILGLAAGCGSEEKKPAAAEKTEITVGTTAGDPEKILEFVAKEAAKQGLTVKVQVFSDYVTPDQALASGDIDLNSMQHGPFLDAFNEKSGTDLVSIGSTYLAPLRVYSHKIQNIADLPEGATVGIPNDPSNGGRALLLLQKQGLIKIAEGVSATKATPLDITENKRNLQIIELEAPQLPRSLDDTTISVINAGYASSAGLDSQTALAVEDNTSPYVNIIASRKADKDNPTYQKFVKIFQSEAVKKYIEETCRGDLIPAF